MAPTRKSRKANKKFVDVNEEWPIKEGPSTADKSKTKKRKLVDLVGPQWTKEELESFYNSYRKYGKDWRKVSGRVRNRTSDMVEALYNMNQAYLSLPEGAATAAGLIAMMTDHYSNLEGSNSENESDELPKKTPSKPPPKRGKGLQKTESKASNTQFPDILSYEPASSSFAALSVSKKKCSGGLLADTRPRAVGKRTPRVAVASIQNRDNRKLESPTTTARQGDYEGAHAAAMALADVFQRGGSPQVSYPPSSYVDTVKNSKSEMNVSKAIIFHDKGEGILGSREAENKNAPNGPSYTQEKDLAAIGGKTGPNSKKSDKTKQKGVTANKSDNDQQACRGIEGHNSSSRKGLKDVEDAKSLGASTSSHNRSRQLFFGDDENGALSALDTLADLSVNLLQPTIDESELAEVKDGKTDSNKTPSKPKTSGKKDKRKVDGVGPDGGACKRTKTAKDSATVEANDRTTKPEKGKKSKPTPSKVFFVQNFVTTFQVPMEEEKVISRCANQASPVSRSAGKFVNPVELSPSVTSPTRVVKDVSKILATGNAVELQTKSSSCCKSGIVKAFSKRENWRSETDSDKRPSSYPPNSTPDLKEKLSHTLSNSLFRRWCRFEWFYSAIDYPWFVQNELVEYLNHVELGHIPRLTRNEWGFIKGCLGKPRRLSARFLKDERDKLATYRESVREHYSALLTGKLEGLPTDLARPLIVGQRVVACHPKFRELHEGSILTVDNDRCRVQFDCPELGVEFVLDIDCMPLNPVQNMPEALRRQNSYASKFGDQNFVVQDNDLRSGAPPRVSSSQSLEYTSGPSNIATSYPKNTLLKQVKQETIYSVAHAKAARVARQGLYKHPCTLSQIQEREADIRALAELSRALKKKETWLMELRNMHDEFSGKQKEIDSISDSKHFKDQYTMVLGQLREANDQVASALLTLRQRNTYNGDPPNPSSRTTETCGEPSNLLKGLGSNSYHSAGTQVAELMENSRRRAKMMVDAAIQAMCSTKEGEDPHVKIGDVLDSLSISNSGSGSSILGISRNPPDLGHANSTSRQEDLTSAMLDPSSVNAESSKMHVGLEGGVRLPSELISSCVSTLLMIQSCTEKQHPPAEVTHILDSALSSVQPCCPENAGLYREIEFWMSIIKNQMLAFIPIGSPILPLSVRFNLPPELPPI
ncbi:protein ALWAYS EARLY 2-like isoform X1 [Carex littledalei]|uniref:Protein ALWAYS EARLY 2-like isoform X1 n=1 Tax=Carex littledalei TaxID=544730 RepID=A0A833VQI6_9POAL|nr:protein ALWAYS EARLY 2-like isoform X1 [Carex littledalei]